ncbi:hypothetical protein BKA69DRAFT_1121205 [Paraphysoderma sedebokerense]|nr:hypothetical protein BKA69DRAFT_1121205 [Paraphysoderma sedebokerense]
MTVDPVEETPLASPTKAPKSPTKQQMVEPERPASPAKEKPPSSPKRTRSPSPKRAEPVNAMQTEETATEKPASDAPQEETPAEKEVTEPSEEKEADVVQSESSAQSSKTSKAQAKKKSKKSVSAPERSYAPGDYVWVRMKGYPTWPGRVLQESEVPARIPKQAQSKVQKYPILFFGTHDYGYHTASEMYPLDEFWDNFSDGAKKKDFVAAVAEAKDNRDILNELIARSLQPEDVTMSAADENELVDSADDMAAEGKKRKSKKRKTGEQSDEDAVAAKKRKKSAGKKVAGEEKPKKARKSQAPAEAAGGRKSNRRSATAEAGTEESTPAESKQKKSKSPAEILLSYRHRLQKWLAKKKDESGNYIAAENEIEWDKVTEVLNNVENFEVTAELLKETKILKVIKVILSTTYSHPIEEELAKCQVREKCRTIMAKFNPIVSGTSEDKAEAPEAPATETAPGTEAQPTPQPEATAMETEEPSNEPVAEA